VWGDSDQGPGALTLVVRSLETGEERVFPTKLKTINRPVWFHHGLSLLRGWEDLEGRTSFERVDVRTGRERVRDNAPRFNPGIALAPDDRTVYGSVRGDETKSCCVVRFDLKTGEENRVYAAPDHGQVQGVSLSPDGSTLAIVRSQEDGTHQQVATLRVDGSGIRRLADALEGGGLAPQLGLAWSRDGQHVYFVRTGKKGEFGAAGADAQVWRVPAAGGPDRYTGISAKGLAGLNISPDGSRLAYTAGERRGNYPRLLIMAELWAIENLIPTLEASK
jgi:dipeptidyl aminopeptidase/acylaminoacyl peptidase